MQAPPDRSSRPLKLLHTADVHVGSDLFPEAALRGFDALLDAAREASVDALLVAGDLFDSGRVPPDTVAHVFRSLGELERPVVVLPGNHDTPLTSPSSAVGQPPTNVHVLREPGGELVTIAGIGLSVWGRPVLAHEPAFHPLEGMRPRPSDGWYVVMAHGLVLDGNTGPGRSSPITVDELAMADCDYIALGHVHQFRDVTQGRAPAFYSGASSESLQPTAALVTLDPAKGVSIRAVRL